MAFQISPGVNVSEVDQTTVVPAVLTTAGAFAGNFTWGPADEIVLVDNELTLVNRFGKPTDTTANSFFTAANFLAYGNNLSVVRSVNANARNAIANTISSAVLVKNDATFEQTYLFTDNLSTYGAFMAKCPGELGNSLKVSVCDNSSEFGTWTYAGYFQSAANTSSQAEAAGGSYDELHIVVVDEDGKFTGTPGQVLETFGYLSKASDAMLNGASNYYKQVLFNSSQYVYAVDPVDYSNTYTTWGKTANTTFARCGTINRSLDSGVDSAPSAGDQQTSFDLFANKDTTDISLILTGAAPTSVSGHVISSIAATRKDCVAFVSPSYASVVNNAGSETTAVASWLSSLNAYSSYGVADSGWKYQLDKYNNVYRWVPLNGDVAGLCVNTDTTRDPWFSPAGFNRGSIKNCIKLSWNPTKTQRDVLYAAGVNPVVTFPGQGAVLFGDKTLLNKPNAFDRINVRRLFIVLEKAIAQAAQSSLFELNDEFTRAQFTALVTPFLRDVQGRRGITDFKVVCDTTNNTPQVIDSNQFVGDIYIKPARSINFIQLNFVAVGTGVDFTTVVGVV